MRNQIKIGTKFNARIRCSSKKDKRAPGCPADCNGSTPHVHKCCQKDRIARGCPCECVSKHTNDDGYATEILAVDSMDIERNFIGTRFNFEIVDG